MNQNEPADLAGTPDERAKRLVELEAEGRTLPATWLRRQLVSSLADWAADETQLDIITEARVDY
ncbi:hypothetical protein J2X85_001110 [Microbacterium trichothecenolyticum]|uniref:hypothetical protein n=1 Tax=Microbacterium trichothecenolyticum TaxID=69370 RepID=UPI002856358D|nr:hypothetical protein [Microbacterium trichothecenolyticum]MDR7184087.1 hypothetical protein [Microbacterium trichothecenolyticum]